MFLAASSHSLQFWITTAVKNVLKLWASQCFESIRNQRYTVYC